MFTDASTAAECPPSHRSVHLPVGRAREIGSSAASCKWPEDWGTSNGLTRLTHGPGGSSAAASSYDANNLSLSPSLSGASVRISEHVLSRVTEKSHYTCPRDHLGKLPNTNGCAHSNGPSVPGVGVMRTKSAA